MIYRNFFHINNMLFPVSLVLFELSVYIANDMIQPAMLMVIKDFNEDIKWVPTSLTAYLTGGLSLQWLFGPLSDKFGRRPVMLIGVIFFIISCVSILLVVNIKQFILVRFLQGIGLCFIGSVGYAAVQEAFEEKFCIKIISLMANIALIAPLLGPLVGAIIIKVLSWKDMFVMFALLGLLSFIGLFFFMPETVLKAKKISASIILSYYKKIMKSKQFVYGSLAIGFANIPLLSWIGLSPLILMNEKKLSVIYYAILQFPVFGGLIIGNIILSYLINKNKLRNLIILGSKPMLFGLVIANLSFFSKDKSYLLTIFGLSIYSFGLGITNACLTRLTLFSSNISKGTVSSAMGIISMMIIIIGMEISKKVYLLNHEENGFNIVNVICVIIWIFLIYCFFKSKKKLYFN